VSTPPDCRVLVPGTVLDDRPLLLGVHAVTLLVDGHRAVYYGWAETYYSPVLPLRSDALLITYRGRAARVVGPGLTLEPFEGPPGSGSVLILSAILCEFVCGLALGVQSLSWRLRARLVPIPAPRTGTSFRMPLQVVFVVSMAVALLAGHSGHAAVAAPLHAMCGLVMASQFGVAG